MFSACSPSSPLLFLLLLLLGHLLLTSPVATIAAAAASGRASGFVARGGAGHGNGGKEGKQKEEEEGMRWPAAAALRFKEAPAFKNGAECSERAAEMEERAQGRRNSSGGYGDGDGDGNGDGGGAEDARCDPRSVHIAMTLDRAYMRGTMAAILSIVQHASCPENVVFHFLASSSESESGTESGSGSGSGSGSESESESESGSGSGSESESAAPRLSASSRALARIVRGAFPYLRFGVYEIDAGAVRRRISASLREALEEPLNYARIYIAELLPGSCVGRVIYLDSDVVLVDDVAKLWGTPMGGAAIAAPEYCHADFRKYFTPEFWADGQLPKLAFGGASSEEEEEAQEEEAEAQEEEAQEEAQEAQEEEAQEAQEEEEAHSHSHDDDHRPRSRRRRRRRRPCYFNTGVMVMDLDLWRSAGFTRRLERWMEVQKLGNPRIYELGSLPPFLLVFAGSIQAIDHRWNQHGLGGDNAHGSCRRLHPGPVSLLHWSGKGKPWHRLDARRPCPLDSLWAPYDLLLPRPSPPLAISSAYVL